MRSVDSRRAAMYYFDLRFHILIFNFNGFAASSSLGSELLGTEFGKNIMGYNRYLTVLYCTIFCPLT